MRDEHRSDEKTDDLDTARDEPTKKPGSADKNREPPRTTTDGWLTTPKFGAAGSGGAELDPGPEQD